MTTNDRVGSCDSTLGRCRRTATGLRDLVDREPFDVTKEPRNAVDIAHLAKRFVEPAQFGTSLSGSRLDGERVQRQFVALTVQAEQFQKTPLAESPMDKTDGDAVNPGSKRTGLPKLGQFLERGDERVLQDVHRIFARPKEARREAKDRRRVTPIEKLFRGTVAFASANDEPSIVL